MTSKVADIRCFSFLKIVIFVCSFVSFLLMNPQTIERVYSCEFGDAGPPTQERMDESSFVFSGTVAEIQGLSIEHAPDQHIVFFEVERYWKSPDGKEYDRLVVFTPPNQGSCGYEFEKNNTYLVYTTQHELHVGALYTALGYGNKPIDVAEEDLVFLGEGTAPTMQSSWDEQVSDIVFQPVPRDNTNESTSTMLLMIGGGGAVASVVAFLILRKLKEKK